jgi:hypothetical protein
MGKGATPMSPKRAKAQAPGERQVLGMIVLSMGLYALVLAWTIPLALLSWTGAGDSDASFGLIIFSAALFVGGGLLLLVSLFFLIRPWLLGLGMLVLAVLAAFVQRWLFPAAEPSASSNWILTFGGTALVLSCMLLLRSIRTIWSALWRTLLVTGVSATIASAVVYVCGQVAAVGSSLYPLVSLLVGGLDILIIFSWLTRKAREAGLSHE